ncbi:MULTISPECIES: hypothetical protein [Pseudoalteromonas]|uniref:hypothetical protein n=1 Tax=Pseudoalteromonas TaxID=53246 RepID=UPI0015831596|nr:MULTISPECIES: hypothetical protein [Pseudoalteromonas]MDI4652966.1 DUF5034 domain-containing protein [Pseudoalteromonas shioyasakiensis]NUJ38954.1 hypothetical protein [Pseudoalteromonas sp. 0303]
MKNLLLASLLASCLAGCNSDSNDELECSPYPIAIDINNYVVTPEQSEANTALAYDAYTIKLGGIGEGVYSEGNEPDPDKEYAECAIPALVLGSANTITAINIYSSADYNNELTAGTSLNSLFDIKEMYNSDFDYYSDGNYASVENFTNVFPTIAPIFIELKPNQAPEVESSHIFYIDISFANGKTFALETEEVQLF